MLTRRDMNRIKEDQKTLELTKKIVPNAILSRSQTINILVNEKAKKLNGKAKSQS